MQFSCQPTSPRSVVIQLHIRKLKFVTVKPKTDGLASKRAVDALTVRRAYVDSPSSSGFQLHRSSNGINQPNQSASTWSWATAAGHAVHLEPQHSVSGMSSVTASATDVLKQLVLLSSVLVTLPMQLWNGIQQTSSRSLASQSWLADKTNSTDVGEQAVLQSALACFGQPLGSCCQSIQQQLPSQPYCKSSTAAVSGSGNRSIHDIQQVVPDALNGSWRSHPYGPADDQVLHSSLACFGQPLGSCMAAWSEPSSRQTHQGGSIEVSGAVAGAAAAPAEQAPSKWRRLCDAAEQAVLHSSLACFGQPLGSCCESIGTAHPAPASGCLPSTPPSDGQPAKATAGSATLRAAAVAKDLKIAQQAERIQLLELQLDEARRSATGLAPLSTAAVEIEAQLDQAKQQLGHQEAELAGLQSKMLGCEAHISDVRSQLSMLASHEGPRPAADLSTKPSA